MTGRVVRIGSGGDCDIVVGGDRSVMPLHCVLRETAPGRWEAEAWGRNGLFIVADRGGTTRMFHLRSGLRAELGSGDVLILGQTEMPPFTPERVKS